MIADPNSRNGMLVAPSKGFMVSVSKASDKEISTLAEVANPVCK